MLDIIWFGVGVSFGEVVWLGGVGASVCELDSNKSIIHKCELTLGFAVILCFETYHVHVVKSIWPADKHEIVLPVTDIFRTLGTLVHGVVWVSEISKEYSKPTSRLDDSVT